MLTAAPFSPAIYSSDRGLADIPLLSLLRGPAQNTSKFIDNRSTGIDEKKSPEGSEISWIWDDLGAREPIQLVDWFLAVYELVQLYQPEGA